MISSLVLSARTGTPDGVISEVSCLISCLHSESIVPQLYKDPNVFIPKMPSLGLLLEEPVFVSYNNRMNVVNEKLTPDNPDYRPAIDFEPYREQIDKFKDQFIYKNMREIEDRDGLCVLCSTYSALRT